MDESVAVAEIDKVQIVAHKDPESQLVKTRQMIKETLQDKDPALAKVWDELNGIVDTNSLILFNIQQAQVHLQKAQMDFYERQKHADAVLKDLLSGGEGKFKQYLEERKRFDEESRDNRKHIQALMSTVTNMAKEYRQCLMQKKFIVHIVQVQQFKMAIEAAIHRHIHDKDVLAQIADEIYEAGMALFPVGAQEDV